MDPQLPDPYLIEAVVKALDVLDLFQTREEVRLVDVTRELGLVKSTAFRILYTLEQQGCLERASDGRSYRRRRHHRIGMVSISNEIPFVAKVENGIQKEAAKKGMDLLLRHHENDFTRLIHTVEEILASGISLLLCYNPDEHASHVIADRCSEAGVPVLAITFPVPGARLFGINNYRAGLVGGEGLGEEVRRRWDSRLDFVAALDIAGDSPTQQARITGMIEGLRGKVAVNDDSIVRIHVDRRKQTAGALVRDLLQTHPKARRIAILSYNDINALGALHAVQEAKRSPHVLILSQGGVTEILQEIRKPGNPMWGAVAHFPEQYGPKLMTLVQRILRGESVAPTIYTEHALVTRANVDAYYAR